MSPTLAGEANVLLSHRLSRELHCDVGSRRLKCLIVGASGSGKTTMCASLFSPEDEIDVFDVKSNPQADTEAKMRSLIMNFVTNRTITSFMSPRRPKLILIDDVDVHMKTERGYASFLTELIGGDVDVHLVMTCQSKEYGKLPTGVKRKLGKDRIHHMTPPSIDECVEHVLRVLDYQYPESRARWLAEQHDGNVRHVMNDLRAGKDEGERGKIENEDDRARKVSAVCADANEMLKHVFDADPPMSISDIVNLGDPALLTLMHDNLAAELQKGRVKIPERQCRALIDAATTDLLHAACIASDADADWQSIECANVIMCGRLNSMLGRVNRKKRQHYASGRGGNKNAQVNHRVHQKLDAVGAAYVPQADREGVFAVLSEMADKCEDPTSLADGVCERVLKALN
jgi:hypothetical protein